MWILADWQGCVCWTLIRSTLPAQEPQQAARPECLDMNTDGGPSERFALIRHAMHASRTHCCRTSPLPYVWHILLMIDCGETAVLIGICMVVRGSC